MEPPLESPQIYQLRIVLRAVSPLVRRRILVRDALILAQLHDLIQIPPEFSTLARTQREDVIDAVFP